MIIYHLPPIKGAIDKLLLVGLWPSPLGTKNGSWSTPSQILTFFSAGAEIFQLLAVVLGTMSWQGLPPKIWSTHLENCLLYFFLANKLGIVWYSKFVCFWSLFFHAFIVKLNLFQDGHYSEFIYPYWEDKGYTSGQIIATPHDLGPQKVEFGKGNPRLFHGNLGWWNILTWPESIFIFGIWKYI